MNECIELAKEIAEKLRGSDCYKRYTEAGRVIAESPGLRDKIRHFKRAQLEYHAKLFENHDLPFEEEEKVSRLYAELRLNADARGFMECEKELLDVILQVQEIVADSCDIDAGF
ncbi:MAG: YlbF family regulator [Clostridiales bacterium]|nr:YlbF family regulator [Clostridiales bacterium]